MVRPLRFWPLERTSFAPLPLMVRERLAEAAVAAVAAVPASEARAKVPAETLRLEPAA